MGVGMLVSMLGVLAMLGMLLVRSVMGVLHVWVLRVGVTPSIVYH